MNEHVINKMLGIAVVKKSQADANLDTNFAGMQYYDRGWYHSEQKTLRSKLLYTFEKEINDNIFIRIICFQKEV